MEVYVALFGNKEKILDWLTFLEQERIPFRYKGPILKEFSQINILVGFPNRKTSSLGKREQTFIIEPSLSPAKKLDQLRKKIIRGFQLAKLPYVHVWYYPISCPTIFLFRQDVDYVHKKGLENLLKISKEFNIRGTYFLNISGEEEFDEKIGHLKLEKPTTPQKKEILQKILLNKNEIANHGYWHYVFRDFKKNYQNIKIGNLYLKKLFGVKGKGFAAPGGQINNSLIKAANQAKLLYSSNELDEGGFPYYPYVQNKKMKVLEIPCYYFCDASFQSLPSYCQGILKNSYLEYLEQQINNNKPIVILGHPHLIGKVAKSFFAPIFREVKKLKIPNYTFEEFANWWKQREKIKISYNKVEEQLIIKANKYPILTEIIYGGRKSIVKINKRSIINLKNWRNAINYSQ
jgi:peptidoglycan/xylan/chitin deacetylase (PgdA/CDA1 family)